MHTDPSSFPARTRHLGTASVGEPRLPHSKLLRSEVPLATAVRPQLCMWVASGGAHQGPDDPPCPFYFNHSLETSPSNYVLNLGKIMLHKCVRVCTVWGSRGRGPCQADGTETCRSRGCLLGSQGRNPKGLPSPAGVGFSFPSKDKVSWEGGMGSHASPPKGPQVLYLWGSSCGRGGGGTDPRGFPALGANPAGGVVLFCLNMW